MEQIVIAIISGFVAVIVAIIGIFRRNDKSEEDDTEPSTNLAANERLMVTLNRTVEAQAEQIDILRALADTQQKEITAKSKEIESLNDRVTKLEKLTIEQALIIKELTIARVSEKRPVRVAPKRIRTTEQGGEVKSND